MSPRDFISASQFRFYGSHRGLCHCHGAAPQQIFASGIWMAGRLFLIGITGLIDVIGRAVPKAVIRGVQLSTGTLLMAEGTRFILGRSKFQLMGGAAEPYLDLQRIAGIPIGVLLGILAGGIVMRFRNNRRFPTDLLVVAGGAVVGLLLGTHEGFAELELGINLPRWLPFGWPAHAEWMTALFVLALTVIDLNTRKDLFVALMILGITLAVGFVIGTALAYALKSNRLDI